MREAWQWDEGDILSMIQNQVKESINLDYKRSDSLSSKDDKKKDEVSKDVSAFANSSGGVIVYGVVEEDYYPTAIDAAYDPAAVTREWLEQVINSRIHRRIDRIRINQVGLATTQPGKVIYVVDIPQSNDGPHMAADHRYYKRFNFQSVPMEDYEVRDVAQRALAPDLKLSMSLEGRASCSLSYPGDAVWAQPLKLHGTLTNRSAAPAEYLIAFISIDKRLNYQEPAYTKGELQGHHHGDTLNFQGQQQAVTIFRYAWSVRDRMPVWEGVGHPFPSAYLSLVFPNYAGNFVVGWEIHSPGMDPKRGACALRSGGVLDPVVNIVEV